MMNIVVPLQDPSYDSVTQTVSELSAIGAPTRPLWVALGAFYTAFLLAFSIGILMSSTGNRPLRIAGSLLLAGTVFGVFWPPMHMRGVETTLTDTLHIAWTAVWGVTTLLAMGFSAASFGKGFRWFTIVTMVILAGAGFMTSLQAPNLDKNLSTPTIGAWERVNIAAFLIWLVIFAIQAQRHPVKTA